MYLAMIVMVNVAKIVRMVVSVIMMFVITPMFMRVFMIIIMVVSVVMGRLFDMIVCMRLMGLFLVTMPE